MPDIEKENWKVYIHVVPKEISQYNYNKYYVGITKQNPKARWENGNGYKKGYSKSGTPFYNAIKKYGWNNIKHIVVANNLTKEDACFIEQELIKILKSNIKDGYGYNATNGGETSLGFSHSQKTKDLLSQKSKERQKEYIIHPLWVSIYQFSDLGEFIRKYSSYQEAFDAGYNGIYRCLNNKDLYAYGNIWRREKDIICVNDIIIPINLPNANDKHCPVYMFDQNLKFIKRYDRLKCACDYFNITHNSFARAFNLNQVHYTQGFLWRKSNQVILLNNEPHMIDEAKIKKLQKIKKIYQFDINGDFINSFESYQDIENQLGFSKASIHQCIYNKKNWLSHGYYWKKGSDISFNNDQPILIL